MPHAPTQELHGGRTQRVILGESELRGEHTPFERGPLGPLDQRLPVEHVVLRDGPRGDALRRGGGEVAVLVEEAFLGYGRRHFSGDIVLLRLRGSGIGR